MKEMNWLVYSFLGWGFLWVKEYGVLFRDWSWWWILLPHAPWAFYVVHRLGLV